MNERERPRAARLEGALAGEPAVAITGPEAAGDARRFAATAAGTGRCRHRRLAAAAGASAPVITRRAHA